MSSPALPAPARLLPTPGDRRWPTAGLGRETLLLGLLLAVHVAWIASGVGGERRALVANLANLPGIAGGAVALLSLARHRGLDPATRRAWAWCGAAALLYLLGNVLWVVYENVLGARPSASAADVLYLAYFPALLVGLLSFPTAERRGRDRRRLRLDLATVLVAGATLVWYVLLRPVADAGAEGATALETLLSVAYPVGDLVMLAGTALVLLREPAAGTRRALTLLAAGNLAILVADLGYGYLLVRDGDYATGSWPEAWYQLGAVLWILAALAQRRAVARWQRRQASPPAASAAAAAAADAPAPDARPRRVSLLPYAALAVGYGLLLVVSRPHWSGPLGGVVLGAVLLTALVVARQVTAVRENRALHLRQLAQEARFRSLVQRSSDLITVVDAAGVVLYQSPSAGALADHAAAVPAGSALPASAHDDDRAALAAALARAAADPAALPGVSWRLTDGAGGWRPVESVVSNLLDDPAVGGLVLNTRDVAERAALEAQLTHQAYHDPLTGLANRARFRDRLAQACEGARAAGRADRVAVLLLDLDGFKRVNDSLGHAAGDELLVEVAARLLGATRGSDTVARLGGDEFAILLENVRTAADASIVADRALRALEAALVLDDTSVVVGASIGIARHGEAGPLAPQALLRDADVALYQAKARGKRQYVFFEPDMRTAALSRLQLEAELRHAIAAGELRVHYQPIVALEGERIVGLEALVRWAHPTRGLLPPADFIPLAEETGLVVPLGALVLREACRQTARWQRRRPAAPGEPPLSVTVNVAGRQLEHDAFVAEVRDALCESGLPPACLVLELTESSLVEHPEATRARLHALKALGVQLAVDDFGTGYSALGYLQQFPIDVLKIDRSFVERVALGGTHAALARTVVALGEALSLRCVAEGIEQPAQRRQLQQLGCELGQGFLFARPLPAGEIEAMLGRGAAE